MVHRLLAAGTEGRPVHVADPTHAMREMVRATRPGGRVVAYDMVHDGIWFARFEEDLVERARVELERKSPDEFLLELTVLAHGRKRELPGIPPSAR